MELRCETPNVNVVGQIGLDYYLENEKMYGKSKFRKLAIKHYKENYVDSFSLAMIDKNYAKAYHQLKAIYQDCFYKFVGLYASNGKLLAHTVVYPMFREDGTLSLEIREIFVANKDALRHRSPENPLKWVYGIYDLMLEHIETVFAEDYSEAESFEFFASESDPDILAVVEKRGYTLQEDGIYAGNRKKFIKNARKKGVKRERCNPNK